MPVNEEETIVNFIVALARRYPEFNVVDNPTDRKLRLEDDDGNVEKVFTYEYVLRTWNKSP